MKLLKDILLIVGIVILSYFLFLLSLKYSPSSRNINYMNPLNLMISRLSINNGILTFEIFNPNNQSLTVYFSYALVKTEFGSSCMVSISDVKSMKPYETISYSYDLSVIPECKKVYVQTKRRGVKVWIILNYEEAEGEKTGILKAYAIT